jgi:hypothetical protein
MLVTVILVSSTLASNSLSVNNSVVVTSGLPLWFQYVVIIVLENHGINQTYGSSCFGNCTFFSYLANTNSLAENYDKGGVPGSLGDYIALTSAVGNVICNGSPPDCVPDVPNIVDRIEGAHLTWKAYMEDYPSSCGSSCSSGNCYMGGGPGLGKYASIHNPFVYYRDITNSTRRCSRIVPANSFAPPSQICGISTSPGVAETDDFLLKDLNSVSNAANYMFLTPNTIDDVHDCMDVSTGNLYLQQLIPSVLNSTLFRTKRAALFITYDEPDGYGASTPYLYAVWASHGATYTKPNFKSVNHYTHFSSLRTIENNWGFLPFFSSSNDGTASDMGEFFR